MPRPRFETSSSRIRVQGVTATPASPVNLITSFEYETRGPYYGFILRTLFKERIKSVL